MEPKKPPKDESQFNLPNGNIANALLAFGGGQNIAKRTFMIAHGEDETDGKQFKGSSGNFPRTFKNIQYADGSGSKNENDDILLLEAPDADSTIKVLKKMAELMPPRSSTANLASEALSAGKQQQQQATSGEMVTFNVKGDIIPVPKCLLEEQAPQFWRIFADTFSNSPNVPASIEDTDPAVFRLMIAFIEFGTLDDRSPIDTEGLFIAAHKYLLDNLKKECEALLLKKMTDENAIDLWILGADHYADILKSRALERIVNNADIEDTDKFKQSIIKNRRDLALIWYLAKTPKD